MEAEARRGLYPIGVVEQLTGLTARQIRYYEANGLVRPERTPGRQRLYSDDQVARLKEVKHLMARGMNLQSVRALLEKRHAAGAADRPGQRPAARLPGRLAPGEIGGRGLSGPHGAGSGLLTSVYPVTNRAALEERVELNRAERRGGSQ